MAKQDEPMTAEERERMQGIARLLDSLINPGLDKRRAFVLLVTDFDDGDGKSRCDYVSNADRDDVREMLMDYLRANPAPGKPH